MKVYIPETDLIYLEQFLRDHLSLTRQFPQNEVSHKINLAVKALLAQLPEIPDDVFPE